MFPHTITAIFSAHDHAFFFAQNFSASFSTQSHCACLQDACHGWEKASWCGWGHAEKDGGNLHLQHDLRCRQTAKSKWSWIICIQKIVQILWCFFFFLAASWSWSSLPKMFGIFVCFGVFFCYVLLEYWIHMKVFREVVWFLTLSQTSWLIAWNVWWQKQDKYPTHCCSEAYLYPCHISVPWTQTPHICHGPSVIFWFFLYWLLLV